MVSKKFLAIFILSFLIISFYFIGDGIFNLGQASFFSFLRMLAAYIIALVFSLFFGIIMGHNEKAFRFLLPIMDILQSVPILGFLPVAVIFLLSIPVIGPEAATIFLIFTCMAWSTLFNIVEGIRTIPQNIRDTANLFGVKGAKYLTNVVFPAIYPPVISGSMSGWGGGWYFLVVGEFTTFGGITHEVFGIGSFIAESAYAGNVVLSLIGIWALAAMVLTINTFVWTPLLQHAKKYKYGSTIETDEEEELVPEVVEDIGEGFAGIFERIFSGIDGLISRLGVDPKVYPAKPNHIFSILLVGFVVSCLGALLIFYPDKTIGPWELLGNSLSSITRIVIAYFIALAWTIAVGILIERKRWLLKYLVPVFDVGQSIPAVAIFPIIVVLLITFLSGVLGSGPAIEIASIILLLTGMQWYLMFNIIRAIRNIPRETLDLGQLLNLRYRHRLRHVILPAIFPAIIAGSIEAIGGGWNATIVSESIMYRGIEFSPETGGLGYLLSNATASGNAVMIAVSVLTMITIIILTDKILWARAVKRASRYSFNE